MTNQTHKPHWQEIAETQSPHELSQGHLFWLWAYRIGVTGSFAALATFIVERMAGTNAAIWEWTAGQGLYGSIGLVFAFAFAIFVYGFYLSEYTISKRLFVFFVAVSFPLFAEVSQTMHRGEETTMARSQASPEFLAAQKALDRMTGANPAAANADSMAAAQGDKARHQAELAACSRYTSPARRAKCERYEQGKIAEADGRLNGYSTASTAAVTAHTADIQSTIQQIGALGNNENHAHPMVKVLMESFGMSLLAASLFMAILIIGSIETALAWLGGQVKDYQKAMRSRGLEIGNQKRDVVRFSHDSGNPAPASASAPVTAFNSVTNAVRQAVHGTPETIGNEMMKAQAAREQVHAKTADMLGNVGSKLDNTTRDISRERFIRLIYTEARASIINGNTAPALAPLAGLVAGVIRHHTRTLGLSPALISDSEHQQIAAMLLRKLEQEGIVEQDPNQAVGTFRLAPRWANRPAPAMPDSQYLHDPANVRESGGFKQSPAQRAKAMELADAATYRQDLRNGSKVFSDQPLDRPVSAPSPAETAVPVQSVPAEMTMPAQSGQDAQPTMPAQSEQPEPELSDMAKQVEADLYPEWKGMVSRQEITPAAQVAKQFISSRTKDKNAAVGITAPEMGRIWMNWQERAAGDGVLTPNPKYQAGNRQPRYIIV